MTTAASAVVRPGALWIGAALAVPASLGLGAGWQFPSSAVMVAAFLLALSLGLAAFVVRSPGATSRLTLGFVAIAVVVAGVWASGSLASVLPAVAGAAGCAFLGWVLHRGSQAEG